MKLALGLVLLTVVLGAVAFFWLGNRRLVGPPAHVEVAHNARTEATRSNETLPSESTADANERDAAPSASVEPLAATPAASGPLLKVRLVSKEQGAPIAGERVFVKEWGATTWKASHVDGSHAKSGEAPLTDADGRVEFEVEPGRALRIWTHEHLLDGVDVAALAAGEVRELVIEQATGPDLTVCGRIVDAETAAAIANAVVSFDTRSNAAAPRADDVPVQSDGSFELRARSWERRFACARAAGYARAVFALAPGHTTPDRALEIRLSRSATLEVRVSERGAPVAAEVELSTDFYRLQQASAGVNFYFAEDATWSASTDASGRAEIRDLLPRAPLQLAVRAPGRALHTEATTVTLEPGERRELVLTLGSGASIVGRVEDRSGAAVAGCEVWRATASLSMPQLLHPFDEPAAKTASDELGRFRFDDVPAGTWLVGPQPPALGDESSELPIGLAQPIHLEASSTQIEVVLRADRGLFLEGVVLTESDEPAEECPVLVNMPSAMVLENGTSDDEGRFRVGPLPFGDYELRAGGTTGRFAESELVTARAGDMHVELRVSLGGSIEVRAVDELGAPQACKLALKVDGQPYGWRSTTAKSGTKRFDALSAGTYTVTAITDDGRFGRRARIALGAGQVLEPFDVVVTPGARLKLRYDGAADVATIEIVADGEFAALASIQRGTDATVVVPPGTQQVLWRIARQDGLHEQSVTLAAGEQRELAWDGKP